jgi:hypothetical protein
VQALEVGDLGLVTGLDQGVEPGLDQFGHPAAQHHLLTEQVRLRLFGEGGGERAGPGSADRLGVGQRQRPRAAGGVALHGDQHRHPPALGELAAHQVARPLRRDHAHVDAIRRRDELVADVQPVREEQGIAGHQARRDRLRVQRALHVVRGQDHDQVRLFAGLIGGGDPQALAGRGFPATRALRQSHPDVHARVAQ